MTTAERSNGHAFLDSEEATGTSLTDLARPERVAAFERWAFEVDTPFRPVAELLEAMQGGLASEGPVAEAFDEAEEGPESAESEQSEDPLQLSELLTPSLSAGYAPVFSNITPSAGPFKGPKVQLDHWHRPAVCDPSTGKCRAAKDLTKMVPDAMNPGFIDRAKGSVVVGTGTSSLQERLAKLIVSKHGKLLTQAARKSGQATAGDHLRVALVDLSGKRLADPEFAGWGSTIPMQGTSTLKVAILYALHQLLLDVQREASAGKHVTRATLVAALEKEWRTKGLLTMPRLDDLFEVTENGKDVVEIGLSQGTAQEVTKTFANSLNDAASRLILKVTLPYIASVLWQSGLYHPKLGGLWLASSYGCHPAVAKGANTKEHVLVNCLDGTKAGRFVWRSNPLAATVKRQNVTALSLAAMFTLLAQGRLGSVQRSAAIRATLATTCTWFWRGDSRLLLAITSRPPAKCGVATVEKVRYRHDVTLVEKADKRYIAVALTSNVRDEKFFEKLIVELDPLI